MIYLLGNIFHLNSELSQRRRVKRAATGFLSFVGGGSEVVVRDYGFSRKGFVWKPRLELA